MERIIVEYIIPECGELEYFACLAEDDEHAKEQCLDAYSNANVTAFFHKQNA